MKTYPNKLVTVLRLIGILLFTTFFPLSIGAEGSFQALSVEGVYDELVNSEAQFDVIETDIALENEGQTIYGTLFMPVSDRKVPLIVQLHGFYVSRSWGPVPNTGETFHMYIGRLLAEQGFASLICDFRGSGISDGEWADTTFTSQLSDAEAILDFACTLEGINKGEIGVLGHSQGGLIGSYLAARDKRVRSLVLWAPVANPAFTYSDFFGGANAISEIMSSSDEYFNVPLYARGSQWRTDIFRKSFFEDLFKYDPVNEISKYDNPLMVISGLRDSLVWPQPQMGELYMSGHNGYEYHLQLDTTHSMGIWFPEVLMLRESVYWSAAWFIKTMHINN